MNVSSFRCWRNEGGVSDITCNTFILVWACQQNISLKPIMKVERPSGTPRSVSRKHKNAPPYEYCREQLLAEDHPAMLGSSAPYKSERFT